MAYRHSSNDWACTAYAVHSSTHNLEEIKVIYEVEMERES